MSKINIIKVILAVVSTGLVALMFVLGSSTFPFPSLGEISVPNDSDTPALTPESPPFVNPYEECEATGVTALDGGVYLIEAEDGILQGDYATVKTEYSRTFVGEINNYKGQGVCIYVNASAACTATFTIQISKDKAKNMKITDIFNITVNGTKFASDTQGPTGEYTKSEWNVFEEYVLGSITLWEGINEIKVLSAKTDGNNIDYFKLTTADATLS